MWDACSTHRSNNGLNVVQLVRWYIVIVQLLIDLRMIGCVQDSGRPPKYSAFGERRQRFNAKKELSPLTEALFGRTGDRDG